MNGIQLSFSGDPNIGLFSKACDKYCLVGNFVQDNVLRRMKTVLETEIVKSTVANTDLVGIFAAMNKNGIILPRILSNLEKEKFNSLKRNYGLNIGILSTKFTAIGNLIVCNDKGAICSNMIAKKDREKISDCLGVEIGVGRIAGMDIVGSLAIATNRGCLVHRDADEKEVKKLEEILKVNVDIGTVNFGSPFVGSGLIANGNGFIAGESTTGPEINRIIETLEII